MTRTTPKSAWQAGGAVHIAPRGEGGFDPFDRSKLPPKVTFPRNLGETKENGRKVERLTCSIRSKGYTFPPNLGVMVRILELSNFRTFELSDCRKMLSTHVLRVG